jgi:predicted nucleic acid-binding protein
MDLILDTNVFISMERYGRRLDTPSWEGYDDTFISAITVSELLVGVHRADTPSRKARRLAFVEAILNNFGVLDFTGEIARIHAEIWAALAGQGQLIGAHDLLIAATAISHGCAVLTSNVKEFDRVPGLEVIRLSGHA